MTEITFHGNLVLPPAKYEYLDHTADVHRKTNGYDSIETPMWSAWRVEDRDKDVMFGSNTMRTAVEQIRCEQLLKKQQTLKMMESD